MSFLDGSGSDTSGGDNSSSEREGEAEPSTGKIGIGITLKGDNEKLQVNEKFAKR